MSDKPHPVHEALLPYIRKALEEEAERMSIESVMYPMYLCDDCRWEYRAVEPDPRDKFGLTSGVLHPLPCDEHADWGDRLETIREKMREAKK